MQSDARRFVRNHASLLMASVPLFLGWLTFHLGYHAIAVVGLSLSLFLWADAWDTETRAQAKEPKDD